MPPDLQKIVIDSAREACNQQQKEMKGYDENATEILKSKGVKVWKIDAKEMTRWIAATRKVVIEHEKKSTKEQGRTDIHADPLQVFGKGL